jgi:hypothetical protein
MERVGEAISLFGISKAAWAVFEVSDLFAWRGIISGDGVAFIGVEAQSARSGDGLDGGGAEVFIGANRQQQPVCDFPVGEDSPLGESSSGSADSACEAGLGTHVRAGSGAFGNVCGPVAIPGDELPGGELDLRWSNERLWEDVAGV